MGTSDVVKKIAGIYVQPDAKKPPVLDWLQKQCRFGALRHVVESFVGKQPELLDAREVRVDAISDASIRCRIPARVADHESLSTFRVDVLFDVNPNTLEARRLE